MLNPQENRQHNRMDIYLPLSYVNLDHAGINGVGNRGITANVSSGGVYFYPRFKDKNLSVNQVLNLSIHSCRQDYKESYFPWVNVVEARGKILRIDKLASSHGKLGIALRFLETPLVR